MYGILIVFQHSVFRQKGMVIGTMMSSMYAWDMLGIRMMAEVGIPPTTHKELLIELQIKWAIIFQVKIRKHIRPIRKCTRECITACEGPINYCLCQVFVPTPCDFYTYSNCDFGIVRLLLFIHVSNLYVTC